MKSETNYFRAVVRRTPESELLIAESNTRGAVEVGENWQVYFESEAQAEEFARALEGTVEIVQAEDWLAKWKESLRPLRVGDILILPDPAMRADCAAAPRDTVIVLEPGLAFGTGEHETTRGCLALLSRYVLPGYRVLDFGCGSGILAIAARMKGAGDVVAVDNDPEALRCAGENARRNGVEVELHATMPDGSFNLILANIQSSVLLPLLPELKARLAENGTLILAGLLASEHLVFENTCARLEIGEWLTVAVGR